MLRITKQTDYGIILMSLFIVRPPEKTYSARDLASQARLPLPMVGKILKALTQKGLLVSHRGAKGGYSLSRHPSQISIAEIIAALEGPIAMTECNIHVGGCSLESFCLARSNWQRINRAVGDALSGISLEDMTRPANPGPRSGAGDSTPGLLEVAGFEATAAAPPPAQKERP
jgi:FeS assembly SUF system regulator